MPAPSNGQDLSDTNVAQHETQSQDKKTLRDPMTEEITRLEQQIKKLEQGKTDAFLAGEMRVARQAGKELREQIEKPKDDNAKAVKDAELAGEMRVARQAGKDIRQREVLFTEYDIWWRGCIQ